MATASRRVGGVTENRRPMAHDPLPTEASIAKLDVSSSLQHRQGGLVEHANFGQNGLIGMTFFSRCSRRQRHHLATKYSRFPLALQRGDHQLYWKRMGEARILGDGVAENRRPMAHDPLPTEASIAKLDESALPVV